VDFVWTRGRQAVGIAVKASATWRGEYGTAIKIDKEIPICKPFH
jgi:hypothetical protein